MNTVLFTVRLIHTCSPSIPIRAECLDSMVTSITASHNSQKSADGSVPSILHSSLRSDGAIAAPARIILAASKGSHRIHRNPGDPHCAGSDPPQRRRRSPRAAAALLAAAVQGGCCTTSLLSRSMRGPGRWFSARPGSVFQHDPRNHPHPVFTSPKRI